MCKLVFQLPSLGLGSGGRNSIFAFVFQFLANHVHQQLFHKLYWYTILKPPIFSWVYF